MNVGVNVAILENEHILLTKRNDFKVWCMPGGAMDPGESVAEAARREVLEETGLKIALTGLVGIYSIPQAKAWCNLIISFTGSPTDGNLKRQESEVQEIRYFHIHDIPRELLWGQRQRIKDALNYKGGGTAWLQHVPFDDVADRTALYKTQNDSGLANLEFYKTYFGLADPEDDRNEIR